MTEVNNKLEGTDLFTLKPGAEVNARVRAFLNAKLEAYGADCESLYITTRHDVIEPRVTFSQDLLALGNDTLEWGFAQSFTHGLAGVFTKPWSFEAVHQAHAPSVSDVERLMQALLDDARYQWSR